MDSKKISETNLGERVFLKNEEESKNPIYIRGVFDIKAGKHVMTRESDGKVKMMSRNEKVYYKRVRNAMC